MTEYRSGRKKGSGYRIRLLDNNPDGYILSSGYERWFRVPEKKDTPPNTLIHYGVKGQKWGVITKEYEPVAVDHRKTGNKSSFVGRIQQRRMQRKLEGEAYRKQVAADLKAKRERNRKIMKSAGFALGAGVLALAMYKGYKISDISLKATGLRALKSLVKLKPSMKDFEQGMYLMDARERSKSMGLSKVAQHFKNGTNILRMRHYREKIRNAKNFINQYRNRSIG